MKLRCIFTQLPTKILLFFFLKSWTQKKRKQIAENKLLSSSATSLSHPCCVWLRPEWCSPAADPLWADGPWRCWWAAWSAASSSSAGLETKNRQIHTVTYNKMHSHNLKRALNWSCSIKLKAVPGLSLLFITTTAEDFLCDSEETKTKCKKKVGFKGPNNQTTFQICNSFCFVLGYLLVQNCSLSWLHLPHPQTAPVLSLLSVLRPALRSSPAVQLLRPLVASCSSSSA